nr:hypothetical protein [uncultured Nitrososphaera sp.]
MTSKITVEFSWWRFKTKYEKTFDEDKPVVSRPIRVACMAEVYV